MHNISRLLSVVIISLLVCEATQSALASTISIGETNVLSGADSGNANLLAAQNATLSQPVTIESLSFYVTQVSGNLILDLYDASGPGALKAQKQLCPGNRLEHRECHRPGLAACWDLLAGLFAE